MFKDELGSFQLQRGWIRKFAGKFPGEEGCIMNVLFCSCPNFFPELWRSKDDRILTDEKGFACFIKRLNSTKAKRLKVLNIRY